MRIHPAILLPLAALALCQSVSARYYDKTSYTNPDTIPVMIVAPSVAGTFKTGYYDLPSTVKAAPCFAEYASPGPVLTFTMNTPSTYTAKGYPTSLRFDLWWVNPDPKNFVDDDDNSSTETDDTRPALQNMALLEPNVDMLLIEGAVGTTLDGTDATLPGTIFWRSSIFSGTAVRSMECGLFNAPTSDGGVVTENTTTSGTPNGALADYAPGTVGVYQATPSTSVSGYSIFFNVAGNDGIISDVNTIGKVEDADMETLKMLAGTSTKYPDATSVRIMSNTFLAMPLWNTYTDTDYSDYNIPNMEDYVTVKGITISDSDASRTHYGLKFKEDQPYQDSTGVWESPNETFADVFDYTFTEDGVLNFKLKADTTLPQNASTTYIFYYRVYVNDGTNNGLAGTDYYRTFLYISVYYPFDVYMGGATYNSEVTYTTDSVSTSYDWFDSTKLGWYLAPVDFPDSRWVYGYEHGWVYMEADGISFTGGGYWYNSPSAYSTSGTPTDEVGWLWVSYYDYPYMYSFKDGGWVYFFSNTGSSAKDLNNDVDRTLSTRIFYSFHQKKWIYPSGFGAAGN